MSLGVSGCLACKRGTERTGRLNAQQSTRSTSGNGKPNGMRRKEKKTTQRRTKIKRNRKTTGQAPGGKVVNPNALVPRRAGSGWDREFVGGGGEKSELFNARARFLVGNRVGQRKEPLLSTDQNLPFPEVRRSTREWLAVQTCGWGLAIFVSNRSEHSQFKEKRG